LIGPLDHIGVAVPDLGEALKLYVDALGLRHVETEEVTSEQVRVAILHAGDTRVELLEPTGDSSSIARFLAKGRKGVHHLAFSAKDVQGEVTRLKKAGVKFIEPAPRPGAQGAKVAFIHPESTGGVLVELVERPEL